MLLARATSAAPPITPKEAEAKTAAQMKTYSQKIPGTATRFEMVPIPAGEFVMGSPATEADRKPDEGPQLKVRIEPFWMGKHEVSWDEYDVWSFNLDIQRRKLAGFKPTPLDKTADVVTRPTKPYTDMTFGMGHNGYPAICMTQLAAKMYCRWLSAKTGHFYRLPTEAEWEYAWFYENANLSAHPVGSKRPNPWGLYDMHGNVWEWVSDYNARYSRRPAVDPRGPSSGEDRSMRGGGWSNPATSQRSAHRTGNSESSRSSGGIGLRLVRMRS